MKIKCKGQRRFSFTLLGWENSKSVLKSGKRQGILYLGWHKVPFFMF